MIAAGCATQEDPDIMPNGSSGSSNAGTTSGSAGTSSTSGSSSGGASAGSGGTQAGGSSAGTSSGTSNGGTAGSGGSDDGGSGGVSMGGGGAGGTTAGGGAGGKAGAGGGGAGGTTAGAGGKGGAGGAAGAGGKGGSGGTNPVEPCSNGKKDANETDQDCGGVCATKCATGKGCEDLTDCVANNVCDASKCRANGCNATNCAYALTRFIIGSTAMKGQVLVDWDNTRLEVRFQMLDATPFDDDADSALNWKDDSVEIYLDLNNGKTATYQDGNDFQINVPRIAGNAVVGIGVGLNTGAVTVTRTTNAAGYTLIVGIPWAALNNTAYPSGKTIGFDVGVNDDSDGGDRNGQIMLYGFDQNYLNTSQFGTLTITP